MRYCELFSVGPQKNAGADFDDLNKRLDSVKESLGELDVAVSSVTEVAPDPKKLRETVLDSQKNGKADIYLFANAVAPKKAADSGSAFKKLFYELTAALESSNGDEAAKIKAYSLSDLGGGVKGYCFEHGGSVYICAPSASLAGRDIGELLCETVKKSDKRLEKAEQLTSDMPEVFSDSSLSDVHNKPEPKKKEGFISSFIPHKTDSKDTKRRKIIVLIALAVFAGALGYVLNYFFFAPMANNSISSEIQQIAYRNTDETTAEGEALPEQDWDALHKINKEIVGWIRMDGTPIDYPVLYRKSDNENYQYYLKHTYKGSTSDYGSIFVDYRCLDSTDSKNVILHGHNMLDGSMFHELVNYSDKFKPKLDYYKKHAVLTFNTPDGDSKWKIISVFKTSTYFAHGEFFNYMQADFNSDAEFMNFVYNVRIRSMFNIPVMVNEDDQILTLSTCSYEFSGFRTVVVARKVREGEDEKVDVGLATVNSSPLYPEVYYNAYGGTRPDPLTFKTADAKGLVSWYDGKGNLIGSEDLTATLAANPTEPTLPSGETGTAPRTYMYYQVIFRNIDDTQIAAYTVREGDPIPMPDVVPSYEDENYYYYFEKWDLSIPGVDIYALNSSVDIYPVYTAEHK